MKNRYIKFICFFGLHFIFGFHTRPTRFSIAPERADIQPQSLILVTPMLQNQCFYGFAKVEKSSKIDPEGLWNSTFLEVYVEPLSFSIFNQILIDFWSILDKF